MPIIHKLIENKISQFRGKKEKNFGHFDFREMDTESNTNSNESLAELYIMDLKSFRAQTNK
jgi:hypothetical protein